MEWLNTKCVEPFLYIYYSMNIKKQLRKPENWQDFETLCKRLWGEIWSCQEIKKNGRKGQAQAGVDIYCVPRGENEYYGIQCKGKDEYSHAQLTKEEIDKEIEKALKFQPKLRKFYFATTADKDVNIEEYIRIKDVAHRSEGKFEVHLFSWDDIVEILENTQTLNWYLTSMDYLNQYSVNITFDNDNNSIKLHPTFLSVDYEKVYSNDVTIPNIMDIIHGRVEEDNPKKIYEDPEEDWVCSQPITFRTNLRMMGMYYELYNNTCVKFKLKIRNDGKKALDNYKVIFDIEGGYLSFDRLDKRTKYYDLTDYEYSSYYSSKNKQGRCVPHSTVLVPGDHVIFDYFTLKPLPEIKTLFLNWQLLSRDYNISGQLKIVIIPQFIAKTTFATAYLESDNGEKGHFYKNNYLTEEEYNKLS
jgi:hypothetical protein